MTNVGLAQLAPLMVHVILFALSLSCQVFLLAVGLLNTVSLCSVCVSSIQIIMVRHVVVVYLLGTFISFHFQNGG